MFIIYHSNHIDVLKNLVVALIKREPLKNAFSRDTFLIPNISTGQWLQMELAHEFSIAANYDCFLPAAFVWHLFNNLFPDLHLKANFSPQTISWQVMYLLPTLLGRDSFKLLKEYLADDIHQRKQYQLSQQIAVLFDNYLIYRPDWILSWERGEWIAQVDSTYKWQAELWRELVRHNMQLKYIQEHRAHLHERALKKLQQQSQIAPEFPQRLFIFSISAFHEPLLQLIHALANIIDVHIMFLNPCRHYWGDINKKQQLQATHPLLVSWGIQGRQQLDLIERYDPVEIDAMVDVVPDTLLCAIQHDLLELRDGTVLSSKNLPITINRHDISFTVHACYSPLREVEILHDYLLRLLNTNNKLELRDILVIVTDVAHYCPYIQAVFGNAPKKSYLPFTILEQENWTQHYIIQSFFKILSLPNSRLQAEEVLALLEDPAIRGQFSIEETQLPQIRRWIVEVGIRWGIESASADNTDTSMQNYNSWQYGLARMLLGYAVQSEHGLFQEMLPYDINNTASAELLGHLVFFIDTLIEWYHCLEQSRELCDWLLCGHQLITTFFKQDINNELILNLLKTHWQQWITQGISAGHQEHQLTTTLIREAFAIYLTQELKETRAMVGSINFCAPKTMRAIPFKVVCMLGMNNNVYPRCTIRANNDLLHQAPRLGDRNLSDEDRYLFLETILCTQSYLYISYVGWSMQDNQKRYPSMVVSELLDYCVQSYLLRGDEEQQRDIAMHRLREHLVYYHPLQPFSRRCFQEGNPWQSYADEWIPVTTEPDADPAREEKFWLTPINYTEYTNELTLSKIKKFFRHPVRAFFQQCLRVNFSNVDVSLLNHESFVLSAYDRYQINQQLLDTLINKRSLDKFYQHISATGVLPKGAFAQLLWQQLYCDIQPLYDRVSSELLPSCTIEADLRVDKFLLRGTLTKVQKDGLLKWLPIKLQVTHVIDFWLEHLFYCAMGYGGSSRLYGTHKSHWYFNSITAQEAQDLLAMYIDGWQKGQRQPLLLLYKCAWSWLRTLYSKEKKILLLHDENIKKQAEYKMQQAWLGNEYFPGEVADPYYRRLFKTLSPTIVDAISATAESFLLPLLRHCMYQYPSVTKPNKSCDNIA